MSKVVSVTAKDGQVVIPSTTPGKESSGYMRVEFEITTMENGFIRKEKRSALIRGKVADLSSLNLKEGAKIIGQIIHKEKTEKSYPEQEPKINPSTMEVVTSNGLPVYRESFYTADQDATDILLSTDKVEVSNTPAMSEKTAEKLGASL